MEVPTLSASQVKGSLSKKSPMPMKSVRRAMKSPYQTFWPVSKEDAELKEILHRLLSPIKRRSARIPWSIYRHLSAEERIQMKNELRTKKYDNNLRKQVYLGMNELLHGLEQHSVSSAIISENVEPTFLVNMTLDLLETHCIPVIMLPKLKEIAKGILGFPCIGIGVKCTSSEDNSSHFKPLHDKIVELANELYIPKNQTLIQCPKDGCLEQVDLPSSSTFQELNSAKLCSDRKVDETDIQKDSQARLSCNLDWKSKEGQLRNRKCGKTKKDVCKDSNVATSDAVDVVPSKAFENGKDTAVVLSKGEKALVVDSDHVSKMDTDIGSGEAALGVESQTVAEKESSVPVEVGEPTSSFVHGTEVTGKCKKFSVSKANPYLRKFQNRNLNYMKLYKQRDVSIQERILPRNASGKYAKAGKHKLSDGNTQKMDESVDNGSPDNKVTSEDLIVINDEKKEEELPLGCYRQVILKETIAKPKDPKKVKSKKKPAMPVKK